MGETMTLATAFTSWTAYRRQMCALKLVAASTIANQAAICDRLAETLGHHSLDGLRKSHVELYIGERLQTCAPVTVAGELSVLRQVLNWCVDEQMLAIRPRMPTVSAPAIEKPLPSDAAFLWVLANVPTQHARALEFMMLTGLSPHELERVQAGDVQEVIGASIGAPILTVLRIGMRADFAVKAASRRRLVPLNGRAQDIWFESTAGIQPTTAPFPRVGAMQKAIRRTIADAPIELNPVAMVAAAISPKLMRKWFASKVAAEQPEHVLQRLLGHAPGSPITRRHYVRSTEDQAQAAVEGLEL